jgi:hypothetical protein
MATAKVNIMNFDEIREKISASLHSHLNWYDILSDTTPGHYGIDDLDFDISIADIWVDIPARTFTFKRGTLSFGARLLASSERDGVDMDFKKNFSGQGKFEFAGRAGIEVLNFEVNESEIDLFEDSRPRSRRI